MRRRPGGRHLPVYIHGKLAQSLVLGAFKFGVCGGNIELRFEHPEHYSTHSDTISTTFRQYAFSVV